MPRSLRAARLAGAGILLLGAVPSRAQDAPTTVIIDASPSVPPFSTPQDATEPTATVNREALTRFVAPTGNYDTAVALTPSVVDLDPNGPGLGEAQGLTIRGFADGQYDVTFDGVPFGDSDDFTHHSSAYFTARDLDSVTVDRGPGDAATLGDATFGGTVSLRSIDPAAHEAISPDLALGSFGTVLGGVRIDSGAIGGPDGTRVVVDAEGEQSGGALEDVTERRASLYAKAIIPLGPDTTLTLVSNLSRTAENDPPGATKAEIAADGPGVALDGDPQSQAFEGDNNSSYRTDITVATLTRALPAGATLTDAAYTYGLDRHFSLGADPNGETPDGTASGPDDVPGQDAKNGLRAWGDIFRLQVPIGHGLALRTGFWIERQVNARSLDDVDFSLGSQPDPVLSPVAGVPGSAAIVREQADTLVTAQPYVDLDWRPTASLLVTAGVKGALFARAIDAPVMEGTRLPTSVSRLFGAPIPSVASIDHLDRAWSVYATVARGFLAPPLQFFDVTDPLTAPIAPETTWNVQAGVTWRTPTRSVALDAYDILFTDAVGTRTVGGETVDFDAGSAVYRGLESEATAQLGGGFSLYGSASLNAGHQSGSVASPSGPVPSTPQGTLSGAVLFATRVWNASLLDRWVGGTYGDVGGAEWIDPVNTLDLSAGRRWQAPHRTGIRLQAQIFNLLDSRKIDGLAGYTLGAGTPLFWTQAGRSLFVSATTVF